MEQLGKQGNESEKLLDKGPRQPLIFTFKGIVAALTSAFVTSVSAICVQALDRAIPDFELNALRSGFSFVGTAVLCLGLKIPPKVAGNNGKLATGLFAFFLFVETLALYVSVTFIPFSSQQSIYNTSSVFAAAILLWILIKEKLTLDKILAIFLCVAGVVLVLQPDFIFPEHNLMLSSNTSNCSENGSLICNEERNATDTSSNSNYSHNYLGYGLALLTGLALAGQVITIKIYDDFFSNINNQIITLFWSCLLSTLGSVAVMLAVEHLVFPSNTVDILLASAHIVVYFFIELLDLYSISALDGNTINILWSTQMVYLALAQYTILKDLFPGHRNWIEVVGIVLIILGSILSSVVQVIKSEEQANENNDQRGRTNVTVQELYTEGVKH